MSPDRTMECSGVLAVDKPSGPTSFDVVRRIRGAARVRKVGHTGTLDPMATGLLVICLGRATKLVPFLQEGRKVYEGRMLLGKTTDTDDVTGRVIEERALTGREAEKLERIRPEFIGDLQQRAPDYSAVRIDGRRAYEMARAGEKVPPRSKVITIYDLVLTEVDPPHVSFRTEVSKGTYIRSLAADIGRALGVGACLEALRRTAAPPFDLENALTLQEALESARQGRLAERLVGMADALGFLPEVRVSPRMAGLVENGQPLPLHDLEDFEPRPGPVRIRTSGRGLLAVYEYNPRPNDRHGECLTPVRVLAGA